MTDYTRFVKDLDERLKPNESFDLIKRHLIVAERRAVLYFIDGFIKDELFEKMLEFLFKQTPKTLSGIRTMEQFHLDKMPYVEVDFTYDTDAAVTAVLSGPAVLLIDGIEGALLIDTRTYPVRSIEEPQKDRSLRGSRDGFVETLIFNTALIRRRIRTENLRMEYLQVGKRTKLDLAIAYVDGLADKKTLEILRKKLKGLQLNNISMTQQALAEALVPNNFFNPFPKFKFTERPDYASACLLDGKIVVVLDNSPSVMVLPTSFGDFFREIDDYYFMPIVGTYTRILRAVVGILTVIGAPIYLLFVNNSTLAPEWLRYLLPDSTGTVSIFVQFLILEFVVDGLRLASLNTPDALSNSLGVIGGLLLSEFAINAGWFVNEAILYMAFVSIASYSLPSFEMAYALKFERILLLVLTQLFGIWGLLGGVVFSFIAKLFNHTLTGKTYLYPLVPFNGKALSRIFIRPNIQKDH